MAGAEENKTCASCVLGERSTILKILITLPWLCKGLFKIQPEWLHSTNCLMCALGRGDQRGTNTENVLVILIRKHLKRLDVNMGNWT